MPTLDDVYRKFGETAEAAQLLETELGSMLLIVRGVENDLIIRPNSKLASDLYEKINRLTLGQLLRSLNNTTLPLGALEALLSNALEERNRLLHSFYRQHNFRRNSDEGRTIMLKDLDSIHLLLIDAYKAVMLLSGVDLDALANTSGDFAGPTRHLPI
jgi:hypothetical protein